MREIKFRAWDKNKKEMIYYPLWSTIHDKQVLYFAEDVESYLDESDNDKDIILMQYTGLKDLTGKEIYEGDIVIFESVNYFHSANPKKYVVVYDELICGFIFKRTWLQESNNHYHSIYPIEIRIEKGLFYRINKVSCIYENPE